jgi:hypothetical protein
MYLLPGYCMVSNPQRNREIEGLNGPLEDVTSEFSGVL